MPHIYKSLAVEALDRFFKSGPDLGAAYELSLAWLNDEDKTLAEITAEVGDNLPGVADEADLFQSYWIEGEFGSQPVDAIMRRAYRFAIQQAAPEGEGPLPIDTFWVTGAGPDFEMHVCKTDERVTVFAIVPLDRPDPGSRRADTRSWAVRAADINADIVQVSGPGT